MFSANDLSAFYTTGVAERWAAVQERLHPVLAGFAERVQAEAARRYPRSWPLYETNYKSQGYVNRGRGQRDPVEDYWVAFDRPPRGAGILVTVSAAEQAVLVGLQLWRARKPALREIWTRGAAIWQPLVERIAETGQARFAEPQGGSPLPWIDRYLDARGAGYLWAGFVYPWNNLPADLEARLLDDILALFPLNEALMEQVEGYDPASGALLREGRAIYQAATPLPPVEILAERVRSKGFTISDLTLRAYHVALQTRPLVILPGISGTGKTRLTRLYADAVHNIEAGRDNPYYLAVAVQPDWHNARDLLGYYNSLTNVYHPTAFLRFLLRAAADPQQPYYACLDEMNLARPEYYLAPILSAMETLEHSIDIGAPGPEVTTALGETISNPLRLPLNLRLIGTVNVDESTFPLSDKILDRANVIELTDVDLAAFRANYRGAINEQVWATISAAQPLMAAAGHGFGYRVVEEMLRFVEQARGALTPTQALDVQIKQKLLPRLRGEDSPRLRRALSELLALCVGQNSGIPLRASQVSSEQLARAQFPESAAKLLRMLERLDQDGFTDFYS
jgi:hypothetical protein